MRQAEGLRILRLPFRACASRYWYADPAFSLTTNIMEATAVRCGRSSENAFQLRHQGIVDDVA